MPDRPEANPARDARQRVDRVNEWLSLGAARTPEEYVRLREAGVTHVADLREHDQADEGRLTELGIVRSHVPVPNHSAPTLVQLREIVQWFVEQRGSGEALYVHCAGGFGRAATMAVGLLVHEGVPVDDAEAQVRAVRPEIRINDEQRAWLQQVEAARRAAD